MHLCSSTPTTPTCLGPLQPREGKRARQLTWCILHGVIWDPRRWAVTYYGLLALVRALRTSLYSPAVVPRPSSTLPAPSFVLPALTRSPVHPFVVSFDLGLGVASLSFALPCLRLIDLVCSPFVLIHPPSTLVHPPLCLFTVVDQYTVCRSFLCLCHSFSFGLIRPRFALDRPPFCSLFALVPRSPCTHSPPSTLIWVPR